MDQATYLLPDITVGNSACSKVLGTKWFWGPSQPMPFHDSVSLTLRQYPVSEWPTSIEHFRCQRTLTTYIPILPKSNLVHILGLGCILSVTNQYSEYNLQQLPNLRFLSQIYKVCTDDLEVQAPLQIMHEKTTNSQFIFF